MIFLLAVLVSCQAVPDAYLVQPLPREKMTLTTSPPCGGVPKGHSHLLSEPGSLNPISWKIITPASGKCSVKLSYGTDFATYHTLISTDNSTDSFGWFTCGETVGLHTKVFQFPAGVTCDACTLQWIWENNLGTYYECIDIEITGGKDSACYGKCKNEGYCSDGLCVCAQGWTGTFCELDTAVEPVHILRMFILFMVLLCIVGVLSYLIWIRAHGGNMTETEKLLFFRRMRFCLPEENLE